MEKPGQLFGNRGLCYQSDAVGTSEEKSGGNLHRSGSVRNKGLGKSFLKLLIAESELLGVERVLLTIREENKASLAVALANGGVVEKNEAGKYYIWIDRK